MSGLALLLAAFLPAIFYICLIYTQTSNHVSIWKSLIFPFFGMCSIMMTIALSFIFPEQEPQAVYTFFGQIVSEPSLFDVWWFHTGHVALIEELSKFTMFFLGLQLLRQAKQTTLYAYMFYAMIVGAMFGMCENFQYFAGASRNFYTASELSDLILARSVFSVVLHMIVCMFTGYFYALSTLKTKFISKVWTVGLGLVSAMLFHGYFNYHLYLVEADELLWGFAPPQTIAMIGGGALLCFFMAKNLIYRQKEGEDQHTLGSSVKSFFLGKD